MRTLLAAMLAMLCTAPVFAASNETLAQLRAESVTVQVTDVFEDGLISAGSGTITFANNKLWCLTAYHVVEEADSMTNLTVTNCRCNADGAQAAIAFDATIENWSEKNDLALLVLNQKSGKVWSEFDGTFQFGHVKAWPKNSKQLAIDSPLISVGTYQGEAHQSLAEGRLRWLGRTLDQGRFDQAEITVFPGSSGGGVFADDGRLVGMTSRALVPRVAFFVPTRIIIPWLVSIGHADIFDYVPETTHVKTPPCSCGCDCGKGCPCGCADEIKCWCDTSNWLADGLWDAVGAAIATSPVLDTKAFPVKLPRAMERGIERFAFQAQLWNMYDNGPWHWNMAYSSTQGNVEWIRRQWEYMFKFPRLEESLRFIPFKHAEKLVYQAENDLAALNEILGDSPYWRIDQVKPWQPILERNLRGWSAMMNATNPRGMFSARREALGELRDMLGEKWFNEYRWFGE